MYSPREGRVHCVMTYKERVRPLRSLPAHLYEVLEEDAEFVRQETHKIVRFITDEGEYGARITVLGEYRGLPVSHVVAAVFAEDFSTRLSARVATEYLDEHVALVADLAAHDRLGLGQRRRRVAFTPPRGWHPIPGLGLDMVLLPPGYPTIHASITVYPVEPVATARDVHQAQREHDARVGLAAGEESGRRVMTGTWKMGRRLYGDEWTSRRPLPGGQGIMVRHLIVLRDTRYVYAMKMEALEHDGVEALHEAFLEMMGSIEAIPTPRFAPQGHAALNFWAD
jgi:hypothetical protein